MAAQTKAPKQKRKKNCVEAVHPWNLRPSAILQRITTNEYKKEPGSSYETDQAVQNNRRDTCWSCKVLSGKEPVSNSPPNAIATPSQNFRPGKRRSGVIRRAIREFTIGGSSVKPQGSGGIFLVSFTSWTG